MPEEDHPVTPIVVKKYANRRLYDTESSIYITLDTLADMVRHGRDFVVYDAKTGDDITRSVLTQIIMEEETRGRNMLPTAFLRQLIGFYGDSMQGLVPAYLERMMDQFSAQQANVRATVQKTMQALLPSAIEETARKDLAMMDRAVRMFAPRTRAGVQDDAADESPTETLLRAAQLQREEIASLHDENARLRHELARVVDTDLAGASGLAQPAGGVRH